MLKYSAHPPWRDLLWFLSVRWHWPVFYQRQLLEWWQAVGWEQGLEQVPKFTPFSQTGRKKEFSTPDWQEFARWLSEPRGPDVWHWVTMVDVEFPDALRHEESAPTVLWSNLPWEKWEGPVLTVVGSRRCSAYGRLAVQQLVPEFAVTQKALIVSGGAYGIDQAAHNAALSVGQPTWVVLGCGLDHVPAVLDTYRESPARLVSPFPPDEPADKWRFPARNRVMAQLAAGVLVVEAAEGSGSLITAAAALEFGKEVLTVLPPFTSPNAAGALGLLRQGAIPVARAVDIAHALGLMGQVDSKEPMQLARTDEEKLVIQHLRSNGGQARWGRLISDVMAELRLERAVVQSVITALEMRGAVRVEFGMILLSGMIRS
jgi:DNA processing protein